MSTVKVAVVTGSNKGIGYGIVKGLCERFKGKVYLTSRDTGRGQEAVKKLNALGFNPLYHQLDVTDQKSVDAFKEHLKKEHGGLDVLVNNAGILFKPDATEPFDQQAEETVAVNYFGLLRVCEALFPLLRENGRVVNVSSSCGHLSRIPSEDLRKKLGDSSLTVENLSKLMKKFVSDSKEGKHSEEGWGLAPYNVSKVGVSALTIIQQRDFDKETPCRNISVNSVHPGYVATDMSSHVTSIMIEKIDTPVSHKSPLTIEQGAEAPLFLALDDHGFKGKYVWCDKKAFDWYSDSAPLF